MRIVMYIIGPILIALAGLVLLVSMGEGFQSHSLSANLFAYGALLGGISITVGAAKRYRGGWQFIFGMLVVVFDIPIVSSAIIRVVPRANFNNFNTF